MDGRYSEPYMPEGVYAEIRDLVYTRFDAASGLSILEKAPLPEDVIALGVDTIRKVQHVEKLLAWVPS